MKALALAALLAAAVPGSAQTPWDVTLPRGEVREIDFATSEGTWMSLDLSPDGRWIVFDLLGHVYRLPAAGGEAECLTRASGVALNIQPRFSPDGRSIAFVSDRGGHPHLWIMDADGSNPRQVLTDPRYRLLQPAWSHDGRHLFALRWDGLHRVSLDGKEDELLVDVEKEGQAEWPSPSRDGRYLYYYALQPVPAGSENRNRGILADGRSLRRLDLATRTTEDLPVAALPGGAFAPEISPDGRRLAYARRVAGGTITWRGHTYGVRTVLRVRDLETGEERTAVDPIETDLTELFDNRRLREIPGYAWSADGSSILASQGGQIRRIRLADGRAETIPFTARVRRTISQQADALRPIDDGPVRVRMLRWPSPSPDGGTRLAFQALNKIWVTGQDGQPRRLTPETFPDPEWTPSWSPDGRWVAFTTWDDPGRGHVWKAPAGGGEPVRLTRQPGEYLNPVWSPDGRELAIVRGPGVYTPGFTWADNPWYEIVLLPAEGGEPERLTRVNRPRFVYEPYGLQREITRPTFGPGGRIFFSEQRAQDGGFVTDLVSIDHNGGDRKVHAVFQHAEDVEPSPDGRWIAWEEGVEVFVHPFPQPGADGQPPLLNRNAEGFAGRQLTRTGGISPRWIDADTLGIGDGDRYYLCKGPADCQLSVREIRLERPRALAKGSVALTGARLVTLDGRKVLESGTVLVRDGRIACVGECDVRGAERVIDAAGTTIIPGFVDMHAHNNTQQTGLIPWKSFQAAVHLAYGVTTVFDPGTASQEVFSTAETIETGGMVGPRTFSAGDPLFNHDGIDWLDAATREEARDRVEQRVGWGAPTVKEYEYRRRPHRQWIFEAARDLGVRVTCEAMSYEEILTRVMDGATGFEHALGFAPQYGDVGTFFGKAGLFYSPTFSPSGPGVPNKEHFLATLASDDETKLRHFLPPSYLLPRLQRRTLRPETSYGYAMIAEGMADVIAAGGGGAIGSHGEMYGVGTHWEIWMTASALGPHGALEVASLHGARFLGAERDLGTLTVGKLADLLVLEKNPLDDIRNTTSLRWVMKGGTLYEADTLDELWPGTKPFGSFPWSPMKAAE